MQEKTYCKPLWHQSSTPTASSATMSVEQCSVDEGRAGREMERDTQREEGVRSYFLMLHAKTTHDTQDKETGTWATGFNVKQNFRGSLVTMTTTHLNQHLIGAVCTCVLYPHPLPLLRVYNYSDLWLSSTSMNLPIILYTILDFDWFVILYGNMVQYKGGRHTSHSIPFFATSNCQKAILMQRQYLLIKYSFNHTWTWERDIFWRALSRW